MTTAEQIRSIRAKTGMTQAAFCERYDIPKRTWENWEAGTRTPPPYVIRLLEIVISR